MLQTTALNLSFGSRPVLRDVTVEFQPGRFTALVGANGSGKSTLLRAMMGIIRPQSGSVLLHGRSMDRMPRRQIAREIAYLPQVNPCPDHITVGELVELAGFARIGMFASPGKTDRAAFRAALQTVGLDGLEAQQVSRLSGGQRQRAFIAMVLAQDAPLILMDEPVNHLDLKYQYAVLDLVRTLVVAHQKTLIMVLHDLNLALAYADETVILKNGAVLAKGRTAEVLEAGRVREGFDIAAEVTQVGNRRICLAKGTEMVAQG